MMIMDERYEVTHELEKVFEPYIIMGNARDYLEARFKKDASKNVKEEYEKNVKITNGILKDKENSPFI